MAFNIGEVLGKFAGGLAGGIGEGIGKVAGKVSDWVPGPQQYRRNKIHEITKKMLELQLTKPFDSVKYGKLREQRDKLENESQSSGI